MHHASLTWEGRFLDSRFRGNDGPRAGMTGYAKVATATTTGA